MRYDPLRHDEPMVISVVVAKYKVERVLIDQGSLANILYWSTYIKMGLKPIDMEPCTGKLYGYVGEQVEIRGAIELESTFGEGNHTRTISILYTIIDVEASYNIIMGWPTLKKLGTVKEVGRVWADHRVTRRFYEDDLRIGSRPASIPDVNVLDFDLDPRCDINHERPLPAEDLKEINIGPDPTHKMKIGTTLMQEDESRLISFLRKNRDVFAWSLTDMLGIDPEFICHHLSISLGFRLVTQRRRQLGEEKRRAAWEETKKLLAVGFIWEIQCPTWLANIVMVKKANGKWCMCTDYTDLNKAYLKDPYPLPSIDWLVGGASGFALLSFMDAYLGYNQIKMHPKMKPRPPS
ncbi:hypothetical protein CR513_53449, partial [Mucuna pruriens]